ncbi:hypothetical protein GH714_030039 [Hevea brasiliensis]|uniref:CCHC-type domain-containing protein n=1 Tax=Hevea brasiliensis TaxID=3981 RepID=A0A6A6M450_HEVBR|nr:hypothetical protein GH714_030039 [Hevea brasiliensis]
MSTQGEMSISEYFLLVKSICAEISELDANEKISEARLRRFLIRGLKKEYTPFVTSIQGWAKQPLVEKLESLLSNQEALAKQMAKNFESEAVLISKEKHDKKNTSVGNKNNKEGPNVGKAATDNSQNPNIVKCYRCGKIGHIKKNCRVKLSKANVARDKEDGDQLKWEQCFTVEVAEGRDNVIVESTQVQALFNQEICRDKWIIDSGRSHHVTGNDSLLSKDVKVLNNVKTISTEVVTSGERKGSLFVTLAGEAYVKKTSQTKNATIWHARLGHLGYQLLQQISSKKLMDDLMGPTKIPSYSGYRYVIVLVDDFSRYTWVKFLKEKSEALLKFAEFRDAVEKEFGKKIKCLRSDNGGEYMLKDFFQYCSENVQKTTIQEVTLDGDQVNLQLCPENNMEVPIDDEFTASNISNSEDGEQRTSIRERR